MIKLRIKTRLKAILMASVATSFGLISCVQAAELTVWSWDPNFNVSIMKKAGEEYKKTHPDFSIKAEDFAKSDLEQKLQTMLASGMTNSLPDIVLIEDYNAPKYLISYPGSFVPLTNRVNYKDFSKYKVNIMKADGEIYGVPFDSGVTGMYYRRDLFKKAGFTEKDLQNITWQRFIEIGKKVKEKTGVAVLVDDPSDPARIRIMMQSAGRWYFDKDGKLDIINNDALKAALKVKRELVEAGITRPSVGWSGRVAAVNRGVVASEVNGVWFVPSIEAAKDQSGEWGIAPIPKLDIPGATNQSNSGGSSWYVLASSKHIDEAVDFLNSTFGSDVQFYQRILNENGAVASYLPARNGASYQHKSQFFGGQMIYADFANWLSKVPEVNYGMYTYEADAVVAAMMPAFYHGMPLEQVLQQINDQLQAQIQ